MSVSKCVGIDLGTKYSVMAMLEDDHESFLFLTDSEGETAFPSAVAYDHRSGGMIAGRPALNRSGTSSEPVLLSKEHMAEAYFKTHCGPLSLSPVEVAAEILKTMKEKMQDRLNEIPSYYDCVIDRAVISVPEYFKPNAREATKRAGKMAGLNVEFTISEPVATMLYECFKRNIDSGIFMVCSLLCGGSFGVSIIRLNEYGTMVLGSAGSDRLTGESFDIALAEHLLKLLQAPELGYDLDLDVLHNEDDRRRFSRLEQEAKIVRKKLARDDECFVQTCGVFTDKSGAPVNLEAVVTRAEFVKTIRPLLEIMINECYSALKEAETWHGVMLNDIDAVLLAGDSAQMPIVSEMLEQTFTDPNLAIHTKMPKPRADEPNLAVGCGAAIAASGDDRWAAVLKDNSSPIILTFK